MQLTVPQRPALPYVDPTKLDEIRRTVHIGHLPKDVSLSPFSFNKYIYIYNCNLHVNGKLQNDIPVILYSYTVLNYYALDDYLVCTEHAAG